MEIRKWPEVRFEALPSPYGRCVEGATDLIGTWRDWNTADGMKVQTCRFPCDTYRIENAPDSRFWIRDEVFVGDGMHPVREYIAPVRHEFGVQPVYLGEFIEIRRVGLRGGESVGET